MAADHQNALVDPLLLGLLPRRLVPVAKAPRFRHPLIGPFLRLVGALPVHRRQEGGTDPARNRAMTSAATAHLGAGQAVLIFPEGVSQPGPALMPLRTGAARDAARGRRRGGRGVALVPVGLVFYEPGTFRAGRALLLIDGAVATADCIALHAIAPDGATRRLAHRLTAALRQQIVEADDRETLRSCASSSPFPATRPRRTPAASSVSSSIATSGGVWPPPEIARGRAGGPDAPRARDGPGWTPRPG